MWLDLINEIKKYIPEDFHQHHRLEESISIGLLNLVRKYKKEAIAMIAKELLSIVEKEHMELVDKGILEMTVDDKGRIGFRKKVV